MSIFYLCCLLALKVTAPVSGLQLPKAIRTKENINANWFYAENITSDPNEVRLTQKWTPISLPHTWNREDVVDLQPGYRRSASWYKKELVLPQILKERQYSLNFEGANVTTVVYVNGKRAGKHIGGYVGFEIDITNYVVEGRNEILVRVDNSYDPDIIPSQKSDFFIYGGITRDVWLLTKPLDHITGLQINTPSVSEAKAHVKVTVTLQGAQKVSTQELWATVMDPLGNEVASRRVTAAENTVTINFNKIRNPKLWDTKTPHLYTLKVRLLQYGKVIDEYAERFGFRWFEFKDYGAFYLNGKRLLLRGTHRHEEHAGVGAAMTNAQHRKDIALIKEMGANFVRLAHYPQDPEVYKACDELGLLVWDELPWCRGGIGGEAWKKNTEDMLKAMIKQHYNHPSIILWSLGNEISWLPDFEGGDNTEEINAFLKKLNIVAHTLDPTRKTAIRKYYEGADIVDVFSPSIWSGWYSGSYKNYQKALDTYKQKFRHFIHAEYGGSSHPGRHSENPITGEGIINSDGWEEAIVQTKVDNIAKLGDWSENYIVDLFDWHLQVAETDDTFVGNVQWAFKDFGTPLRPENDIPYVNQKGLLDRGGNPKDAFYVFKSYWSKKPFTYIESHTWTERQGPKGLKRNINVFSNCKTVTLYHNGKNMGEKIRDISHFPASGLHWDISFNEGDNQLIAIGDNGKGTIAKDTLNVNYRYAINDGPESLALSSEELENGNYLVTALAVDKKGLRCLNYEDRVYFQCLEGGKTLKNQGTSTGSEAIAMANGKASIEVIPDGTKKPLKVMVLNQSFKGTYLSIAK